MTGKNAAERGQDILTLLAHGGNIASDAAEDVSALPSAKAARDFLADLGHAQVTLGLVVVERDPEIVHEGQDRRLMFFQAQEQAADRTLAGPAAPASAAGGRVGAQPGLEQVLVLAGEALDLALGA